jgi:uncharacterized membrane protein YhaH (DUF805 family)
MKKGSEMDLWKLLFSVDGRISKKPFWIYFLCLPVLELLLLYLLKKSDATTQKNAELIFIIVFAYPSLAVQIKRWHDLNKSAGSTLINFIPYVGMIYAFIELGFLDGTHGENKYGPDPLGRTAPTTQIKTYIDAQTTPYLVETFLFVVLPGGILYLLLRSLIKGDTTNTILLLSLFLLFALPLFFLFKYFQKYRTFKIETDVTGVTYYGLLKEIQSKWEDVLSVTVTDFNLRKMLQVKTKRGAFIFPLSMKENNKEYPQLRVSMDDYKWEFSDGKVSAMTPENCSPYLEIKERINGR